MSLYAAMPLWVVLSSLLASVIIFALGDEWRRTRTFTNIAAAVIKLILVGIMLAGVARGDDFGMRVTLAPGLEFVLHADALTMLLITLSAILWLVTTIYAIGYLEDSPNRARFFGFFSLCVAATMGVASAGNLFTFFIFYELLTLSTWPLVVHRGTPRALRAGKKYLAYTLSGGTMLLIGIIGLHVVAGPVDFVHGGFVTEHTASRPVLTLLFLLMLAGTGVKAALFPLHAWLPTAMVAPAPVSALLHAVAVVKVGIFGVARLVYDVYGLELTALLGMDHVLAGVAAFTIIYGSVQALFAGNIKQRLAWSTVSQVSYIGLGIAIAGPLATIGGLVHLVHQGLMKITLFFCAGNLSKTHEIKEIAQMDGVGWRMPWTMGAFTFAALSMIGVPPMAGFISKWYLGLGGAASGDYWVIGVLVASTLLNAAYFLPMLRRAWFVEPVAGATERREAPLSLLVPTLITGLLAVGSGFLAGMPLSPLQWVILISERI
ncbi:MAG: proton-conducting transporter membrane subunit [Wenzhouxiangellaceae bacterium]